MKRTTKEIVPRLTSWFNQLEENYQRQELEPTKEEILLVDKPSPAPEKSGEKSEKDAKLNRLNETRFCFAGYQSLILW